MSWLRMEPIIVAGWTIVQRDGVFIRRDQASSHEHRSLLDAVVTAQRQPHPSTTHRKET